MMDSQTTIFIIVVIICVAILYRIANFVPANELYSKKPSFEDIVIFGDSLSDEGNLYARNHGIMPVDPPYYKGRFSNYEVWADVMTNLFAGQHKVTNSAVGGEVIKLHLGKYLPWDLGESIYAYLAEYLKNNFTFKQSSSTLFIIWIGGNDYLNGADDAYGAYTSSIINKLKSDIETLIYHEAKQFLIPNLPDLSKTPYSIEMKNTQNVKKLVMEHNAKLKVMVAELSKSYPDIKIKYYDVMPIFNELLTNTDKINKQYSTNITNTTGHCWQGGYTNIDKDLSFFDNPDIGEAHLVAKAHGSGAQECTDPNSHVYWDRVHPTRPVHKIIGTIVTNYLRDEY
jgi:phospholipase/lecithinase/hemolysin